MCLATIYGSWRKRISFLRIPGAPSWYRMTLFSDLPECSRFCGTSKAKQASVFFVHSMRLWTGSPRRRECVARQLLLLVEISESVDQQNDTSRAVFNTMAFGRGCIRS